MPAKKRVVKKAVSPPDGVFERLRGLLEPYARHMVVKYDGPGIYYLESAPVPKYGTEVFFGAVKAEKKHVSFHLMPLYVFPELHEGLSPALRKRLRGKSKFNFTELDAALLRELTALTRRGYQGYRRGGVFAT